MKSKDELEKELEELSPFLQKMKGREEGFRVPKNYFRALPDEVLKKSLPAKSTWLDELESFIHGLFQPKYSLAMAAVLVLVVAAVCIFQNNKTQTAPPVAGAILQEIPDEVLQAYVSTNISDFDKALILEMNYPESTLPDIAPKPTTSEVEQYLENHIDELDLDDLEDFL